MKIFFYKPNSNIHSVYVQRNGTTAINDRLMAVMSIGLFVCPMLDPKWRTKGYGKLKNWQEGNP